MTQGFAAVNQRGEILVKTVSDTRRAAMVNWLITELHFMVTLNMTDEMIEKLFIRNALHRGLASIEAVTITTTKAPLACLVDPTEAELATAYRYLLEKPSTSYIQRKMGIGYNRAAAIMETLEQEGCVSAPDNTGKRIMLKHDRPFPPHSREDAAGGAG